MKIIYLHQYFRTPSMVGMTRSYEMARRLVSWGHEVHMVTARDSRLGTDWLTTEEAGIQVHWCQVPYSNYMSYPQRIRAFLRFSWRAARKTASLGGDVVFATSAPLTVTLPGVYAARRNQTPMVFEVRDLWPETPIAVGALRNRATISAARQLERFAYRNAAEIVALSPDMRDGIVATGYPIDRVTVIPNSCDFPLFQVPQEAGFEFRRRHAWLGDRPLVVYTGTMGLVNGVDYLARVAAAVHREDPEIRFLVVGEGREEEKVRQAARKLGILDRSFFIHAPITKAEMPAVLSAADIATSTVINLKPLWANSANKMFDGMAAGCPIAINHGGWMADIIESTGCGLVLPPEDERQAGHQLLRALRDPEWLRHAGEAAVRVGRQQFDRDKLARQLESVLLRVVPEQRRLPAAA